MGPIIARWVTQFLDGVPNFLMAVAIFVVAMFLAQLVANLLRSMLQRRGVVSHVIELLARLLYWTILVVGTVMALQRFFDVTAFLAGLGILGFTVGFALQDVMKNFAAGIILLVQQPFRIGEAISVAGFEGTILEVDLRATEMSTFDGRLVSIPNATILTNPIINFTRAARRRVDLSVPIGSADDLEAARRLLLNAIRGAPGALNEPAPAVVLQQISETSLMLAATFWVDVTKANPEAARDAALTQIKSGLRPLPVPATSRDHENADRSDGQQLG